MDKDTIIRLAHQAGIVFRLTSTDVTVEKLERFLSLAQAPRTRGWLWFWLRPEGCELRSGLNLTLPGNGFVLTLYTQRFKYRFRYRKEFGRVIDILNWDVFKMDFKPTDITYMLSDKRNERISVPKSLEMKQQKIFDAVICAKQIKHLMTDPRSISALDIAEKYGRGEATEDEFLAAHEAAWDAARSAGQNSVKAWEAAWSLQNSTSASDVEKEAAWNRSLAAAWDSSYAAAAAFAMDGKISEGLQAAIRARSNT